MRHLESKGYLIIAHPVALPQKYCVNSVGRIASGKVVVIRQIQPSGILYGKVTCVISTAMGMEKDLLYAAKKILNKFWI